LVVADIDNTIANVNALLYGAFDVPEEIYPAPTPPGFWEDTGLMIFAKAQPLPGAAELLKECRKRFGSLVYLTCRPRVAEFVTRRWLELHGFPIAPVRFCESAREKVARAELLGAVLALEDDPETVEMYDQAGIPVLMPDWPYNRHVDLPGVARVKGVVECGGGA
jgi:uncharacterized HAD superfamily protein